MSSRLRCFDSCCYNSGGSGGSLSHYGVDRARLVAQERHQDWDAMTEDEREAFIDEVVHED